MHEHVKEHLRINEERLRMYEEHSTIFKEHDNQLACFDLN